MSNRVVVGMSGGVDSAVAAYLMRSQGCETIGVFMNNWADEEDGTCSAAQDFEDVKACCAALDIPYYSVNFQEQYMQRVFKHFLSEYRAGRTPNPDVLCNREIKFKELLNMAKKLGANRLVTGHYARTQYRDGYHRLLKGLDGNKDQSYFLYMLGQEALGMAQFPLGDMQKPQVRDIAAQNALPVAKKRDSTGVCFIGERNFKQFLQQYLPAQPGDIVTEDGRIVGRHDGLMYYTIGQRGGMNIGGVKGALNAPWFVAAKDIENNRLVIVQGTDNPALFKSELFASQLHWTTGHPPDTAFNCMVKIRYRQADQAARATITGGSMHLAFDRPQRAVTPGQSAVLYLGEECIGGGIIDV